MKIINWPTKRIKVISVDLDPKNVRLDLDASTPTQDAIINDLFNNENTMQIVDSIAQNGFFNQEMPILTEEEGGRFIVLEGNRRFAAIKAILNPSLVPQRETRLKELVKQMGNVSGLQEIEVKVAPNRSDAAKVIASIHTENTRRSWSPLRQAHFYYAQVSEGGKTIDDLKKEYPNVDIPSFVKRWEIHNLAKSVDYQNDDTQRKVASKKFPISTMERLYNNPEFMNLARMSFNDSGELTINTSSEDLDKLIRKIVGDIYSKRIDTRVLNKKDSQSYKEYMTEISGLNVRRSTKSKKASSFTPISVPKVTKSTAGGIAPKDVACNIGYPAVDRMLNELKTLNYHRYPNAAHDLIRSFLECSLKAYFDYKNIPIQPKRSGGYVYLDDVLNAARSHFQTEHKAFVQPLNKLLDKSGNNSYAQSSDILNATNHNPTTFATAQEVKDAWDNIELMIKYVLDTSKHKNTP